MCIHTPAGQTLCCMLFILCDSFHPQQPTSFHRGWALVRSCYLLACVVSQVGGVRKSRVVGSCCGYCPVVFVAFGVKMV